MGCKVKSVTYERVPPNSAILRGTCDGSCDADSECRPHFTWDSSNAKNKGGKVTASFQPFSGGEAVIEITAESDIDDGEIIFGCFCPPDKDGKEASVQKRYHLTMSHQTTLVEVLGRIVDVVSLGLKPLIEKFLTKEATPSK